MESEATGSSETCRKKSIIVLSAMRNTNLTFLAVSQTSITTLKKSPYVLNCFLWLWEAGEEILVLALFSSEPCNYLNPVHTRPYPELGNRRGIHRFVHLAIVVWAVTGHCWGPHTGFTHSKFRHSHLPWNAAITHPVPQLGRPET